MSRTASNRVLFVLSLVGSGIAAYLTLAHANYVPLGCTAIRGCEEVAAHPTAFGFGIGALSAVPTAAFGLAFYAAMAAGSFLRVAAPALTGTVSRMQWLASLSGLVVSGWLTYIEAYVIRAWCQWCIASAVSAVLLFAFTTIERMCRDRELDGTPAVQAEHTH